MRLGERRRLRRWRRGHASADGRTDGYARADGHALSRLPLSDEHARADEYAEAYRHEHAAPTDGDAHEDANGDTHEHAFLPHASAVYWLAGAVQEDAHPYTPAWLLVSLEEEHGKNNI